MAVNAQIIVSLRNQADPEVRKLASSFRDLIQKTKDAGAAQDVAERKALAHAQALARLAIAGGQAAQGEKILTAAISQVDKESNAAIRAQTQLANIQNKNVGVVAQLKGALGGLGQALGGLGIGFGVQQLVAFGKGAAEDALQLRETKNSLRAVAGDTKTYAAILGEARNQQLLFGGSLQENIEGLQGLAVTSRQTGAQLSTLIDLQKRLTVLNPAQGAQGGLIALNEALAGNIASLSRRFNIPRAALQALNDTSKPVAERLQVLDKFLASVGITSDAVAGKVDQGALAFRRLGQELGDLKTGAGDRLATSFTGAATGLARLIGLVNQNPEALAEIRSLFNGSGGVVKQEDIDRATRDIAGAKAAQQLGGQRGQTFAAQRLGGIENLHLAREQLTELNVASGTAAEQAALLTQAFRNGTISGDTYRAGLQALTSELQVSGDVEGLRAQRLASAGQAQDAVLAKIDQLNAEIGKSARASVEDAGQKDLQQAKTALLAQQTKAAVGAFLALNPTIDAAGVAALIAAGKIDPLIGQLVTLRIETNKTKDELIKLANAQNQADTNKVVATNRFFGRESGRGGGSDIQAESDALVGSLKKQNDEQERIHQSEVRLALKRAQTSAERIAILQRELSTTTDIVARNELLGQIEGERQSSAKRQTSELGKQLTLEERIRDAKISQLKASLDASAAIIRDRQQRRQEDQEIKTAQRILGSGRASQQFKDAAADKLALIGIEQQQRILDINEKLATAGGQIIGGRVFQGKPVGDVRLAPIGQIPPSGALPAIPTSPGAAGNTGLPQIEVLVTLDGQQIAANVVTRLRGGLSGATSAGAGKG